MDEMTQAEASMPATRGELKATEAVLRDEIKTTADALRGEIRTTADALRDELKSDIQGVRAELKGLDKKLDASVHRLATEIVRTQEDVRDIKASMSTKDDVRNIMAAIESFAGKAEHYDRAAVLHGHSLTDLEVQVKDHEGRLKKLESGRS